MRFAATANKRRIFVIMAQGSSQAWWDKSCPTPTIFLANPTNRKSGTGGSEFRYPKPCTRACTQPEPSPSIQSMKLCGRWFIGFGIFLFVCGLAGFLSNPSGAKTALLSGGTFGFLSAVWGVLMLRGFGWAWMAALGCTGFLAAVFTWRAAAGWIAVSAGEPKLFAASLISLMLAGSLVSIGVLVKNRRRG